MEHDLVILNTFNMKTTPISKRKRKAKKLIGPGGTSFDAKMTDLCFMIPSEKWDTDSSGHPVKVFTGPIMAQFMITMHDGRKVYRTIKLGDVDWIGATP